jgi:hypothetical protein
MLVALVGCNEAETLLGHGSDMADDEDEGSLNKESSSQSDVPEESEDDSPSEYITVEVTPEPALPDCPYACCSGALYKKKECSKGVCQDHECIVPEPKIDTIRFDFSDNTSCDVSGKVFLNNDSIGSLSNSSLTIDKDEIGPVGHNVVCLKGKLSDCYSEHSGWHYDRICYSVSGEVFEQYDILNFDFNPGNPRSPRREAMMNYVRPQDVEFFMEGFNYPGRYQEDIDYIFKRVDSHSHYIQDGNYALIYSSWKYPNETLTVRQNDCEDFSTALLSCFLAYDPDIRCYNLHVRVHLMTMCKIVDNYIIYDQKRTKIEDKIDGSYRDQKRELKELMAEYYESYGISPEYRQVYYAFDDENFWEFSDNDEFYSWALGQ